MAQIDPPLAAAVNFRASQKMADGIEAYRRMRRLPKAADAARELMESALDHAGLLQAANEARALGIDPLAMLREHVAKISAS